MGRDGHKREHERMSVERERERGHVVPFRRSPLPPTQVAIGFGDLLFFTCSRPDVVTRDGRLCPPAGVGCPSYMVSAVEIRLYSTHTSSPCRERGGHQ